MSDPSSAYRPDDAELDLETVRQSAFYLWERDGRPFGDAERYWFQALEMHRRQIAYDRWLSEMPPRDEGDDGA